MSSPLQPIDQRDNSSELYTNKNAKLAKTNLV